MHDIKTIRKNSDAFQKKIIDRNVNIDLKKLLNLDHESRQLIQKKEKLEQEKKIISQKKDTTQFKKSKEKSMELDELSKKQNHIKKEIDFILILIQCCISQQSQILNTGKE